jgi:hypothetical protein
MRVLEKTSAKKTMRVVSLFTGAAVPASVATIGAVAPTPAFASTKNYELNVHWSQLGVSDFFVCGYNQNNKWVCSNDYSNLITNPFGFSDSRTIPNWWWHGKVRLWWDHQAHHASCTLPTGATSGNWTSIWANTQTAFGTGTGNCKDSIG